MPSAGSPVETPSPPPSLRRHLATDPPRATGFIVTIYGDVAEPRGGRLWMGTLIDACADHGISENLVRTAVSRLVGAGRLAGDRRGRKSFYHLTDSARAEFKEAARVLYTPPPEPSGWLLAFGGGPARDAPEAPGWVRVGSDVALAPNRSDVPLPDALLMSAETIKGEQDLPGFAARHWPLDDVAAAYRTFIETAAPIEADLTQNGRPEGPTALAWRLRLVHLYRQAALADPRLPRAAWPADWPGDDARRLFVRAYLTLADGADRHVGSRFHDSDGRLPAETAETRLRLDRLKREARR